MKLNEALKLLNDNNYITEFLQASDISANHVVKRLEKEFNIKLKPSIICGEECNDNFTTTDLQYSDLTKQDIEKIENIGRIFNVNIYVSNKEGEGVSFGIWTVSPKSKRLEYNPYFDCNLFLHSCFVKPDIIMKTGLRAKQGEYRNDGYGMELGWGGVEKGGERRIYMSAIALTQSLVNKPLEAITDYIIKNMDNLYGLYHYLIKLPKTYPIRKDPEGDDGMDWVYTINSIPKQFILYLGFGGVDCKSKEYKEYPIEPAVTQQEIFNFIKSKKYHEI